VDDETHFLVPNQGASGRLEALQQSGVLGRARELDIQLAERQPAESLIYWRATPIHASAVGYRLAAFDRESRRATRMLDNPVGGLPRPVPMSRGGFEIVMPAQAHLSSSSSPWGSRRKSSSRSRYS
jgi:hypothetical protein